MLRYKLYIKDIDRAIELIEKSTLSKTKGQFDKDQELIDATAMRLQVIGESIKKLPENLKEESSKVPWRKLAKLRNIISHKYFVLNKDILWSIVKEDIPRLKKEVKKRLNEIKK